MQTRSKLKSDENDSSSRGSTGEKMTEEEKSRTDSLWESFLSDASSSSKTQNSSKSAEKSANASCQDEKPENVENSTEKQLEESLPTKCETEKISSDDAKTVQSKKTETESANTLCDDSSVLLKIENNTTVVVAETTDTSSCQKEEITEDSNCSEENIKLDSSSSRFVGDNKNNSKFSLLKKETCKGFSSPLATLGCRKRGISSILNATSKATKLTTLEKSKRDWNQFKDEHKLEEELSTFNRGKNGYLEKQDFLQRTDLKQFEIEKELRNVERRKY